MSRGDIVENKFSDRRKVSGRVSVAQDMMGVEVITLYRKWESGEMLLYPLDQRDVYVR